MFKKVKSLLSLLICISVLCTVMPITSYAVDAAENAASVTFDGNTEYYTTIDDAWNAAVALNTTAENKATIQLLNNCTAENTLTNTEDYLVLNTNAKTLTTPSALYPETTVRCGIGVDGGSLEIIGNGIITGVSRSDYGRALLLINGGKVYADGITLHNTGLTGSNVVRINGGEFYLLDGQLIADDEYALYVSGGKVYLYSGKLSTTGRMTVVNDENSNIQICYSEKPLYFIDDTNLNWYIIENDSAIHLEDNLVMDLEYSDNPDGSDSKMLRNVTQIDNIANEGKKYLKIQTYKPSYLFSTDYTSRLLNKIRNDKITEMSDDAYTAVHFVNLADYDLTDISYSDYSAKGDGSVKAWVTGTELYIGGYGKIIAGKSLFRAFMGGYKIDKITGLEMLDTSNVTNMAYMFYTCGSESTVFTLDLGDNFDTSKVKDMTYMFCQCGKNSTKFALDLGDNFDTSNVTKMNSMFSDCGYNSPTFTLDLGAKFDTSNVTNMYSMFSGCGFSSTAFTTLDLSTFTVNADTEIGWFANKIPVTKFIFGKGWRNATLPVKYPFANCSSSTPTEIVGATKNLLSYKWTRDNRIVTFTDNITYEIIPITENGGWATEGGTVTGGGTVLDGESITLTATVDEGYSFDGWYDGDTKVCDTAEFVVEDAAEDKTYTAKFAKTIVYYTVSAESGTEGGTVTGGGEVVEGGNITLTATADEGYTFNGWYDGDTKVCDTAEFVVTNVTADKTYTAKFTKNQVDPDPEPSKFDFTTIRTLRTKDIAVNHSDKTITMTADGNVKNVVVYHNQLNVIPGGTIKLADAKGTSVTQNSGSFYIINNAGTASVPVDVTINGVTEQYTLSVNFSDFVTENLRVYQRKLGSTQNDIVYGTDVGYVAGNEIHIMPDAGVEYVGITKYQGTPGNYKGIITPVETYPTYSTFEESTSSNEAVFVDWQGCIFVKRPTEGGSVKIDVNYSYGMETSVYKVIVDFTAEPEFAFSSVRSARAKNIEVDHSSKTITMDSDGKVSNVAIYKYQLGEQNGMQITLADKLNADVTQNGGSFYIKDNGSGTASVLVNVSIGNITKQYTLTVNFADAFDFTNIRTLRTKNAVVDHKNKTITVNSDGIVSNIVVYKAQNDIIKGGSIILSDSKNASVVQNAGSFYIKDDGTGTATVLVDITIGKITKQYTLIVNFSDGFDFETIRTLRAYETSIDHDTQKIIISASKGAKNVALYMAQTGVINSGKLTITDEMNSIVQRNSGSYYIMRQDGMSETTVSADITIGGKTRTYEITICFAE